MHDFFFLFHQRLVVCLYCVINSAVFWDDGARCVRSYRASDYEWNRSNLVFAFFIFLRLSRVDFFPRMKMKAKSRLSVELKLDVQSNCVLMWSIKKCACVGVERSSSAGNWRFSSRHRPLVQTYDGHKLWKTLNSALVDPRIFFCPLFLLLWTSADDDRKNSAEIVFFDANQIC